MRACSSGRSADLCSQGRRDMCRYVLAKKPRCDRSCNVHVNRISERTKSRITLSRQVMMVGEALKSQALDSCNRSAQGADDRDLGRSEGDQRGNAARALHPETRRSKLQDMAP